MSAEPAEPGLPEDADAMRGHHFGLLIRKPLTIVLILVLVAAAGIAAAIYLGAAIGAGAAVAALLVGLLVVLVIADSRSADDFFTIYTQQRGMTLAGHSYLPTATPLLSRGDERYLERGMTGQFAGTVLGTLGLFTYEESSYDSKGNRQTNYYRYTVGFVEVPESAALVPELYCQRKFGLRALEGFEDAFRGSKERVKLESEVVDRNYEIFTREGQDAIWLRRLFSPTFIVWMTEQAPEKFAFELVNGILCCYVNGHKETAAELDAVREASAAVATRLRDEALE